MGKVYGILVIGCGHIGRQHLEDIYYRDNVRIQAVVDADFENARLAARQYGAAGYGTDYRPCLDNPAIDIVLIATYTSSHLSILRDCLAHGKHVLCEKPIAANEEDGRAFFELASNARQKVLVAHILRHNRSYIRVRELIRAGAIGEVRLMRMVQNHHAMNWERYKRLLADCSPMVDCGVHYIDVMQWFTGASVVEVSGVGTTLEADSPDMNYGLMTVKLSSGCIGYYEAGWSRSTASENRKEFIGTAGRITLELEAVRSANREEGDLITVYHSDTGTYETINLETKYKDMYAQLETLIDMIETDSPGRPTLKEAYDAFYVALKADEAIRQGRIFRLDSSSLEDNRSNIIQIGEEISWKNAHFHLA